jgi:hypothetical protein
MAWIHLGDHSDPSHGDPPPGCAKGLVKRNYATHPKGCYASIPVATMTPMSDADIVAAIARKDADKSWLTDLRDIGNFGKQIPSLGQNGKGYCWAHDPVSGVLLCRARDHSPFADLSAFAVACIIKGYRDEGGWAAEACDFIATRGVPTSQFWPQRSMARANDNPATWANAATHKITLKFADIQAQDWRMAATYIINDIPVTFDIDAWSHSVIGCRVKAWLPKPVFTIWNSWLDDGFGIAGMGDVSGAYLPNDMVAVDSVSVGMG